MQFLNVKVSFSLNLLVELKIASLWMFLYSGRLYYEILSETVHMHSTRHKS